MFLSIPLSVCFYLPISLLRVASLLCGTAVRGRREVMSLQVDEQAPEAFRSLASLLPLRMRSADGSGVGVVVASCIVMF